MKFYKFLALLSCITLIVGCFLPWAYYPDLDKVFTGFFSEKNIYGKPGKVFIFFAVAYIVFALIDKLWAKRVNVFIAAVNLAFMIKTWVLYLSCYGAICPEYRYGIFFVIVGSALMMLTAVLPNSKLDLTSLHDEEEDELLK